MDHEKINRAAQQSWASLPPQKGRGSLHRSGAPKGRGSHPRGPCRTGRQARPAKLISSIFALVGLMIFTGLLRPALTARSDPSDLPADQASRQVDNYARGAWVTYRITRFQTKGAGLTKLWNSELKIISLGADEDSRFTWLEIITNEGKEYQKVIRFLINKNKRPIPKKLVIKVGALPPTEIDIGVWSSQTGFPPRRLFHDLTKKIIIIPINRLHHNETKVGSGSVRLKGPNPPPNFVGRASRPKRGEARSIGAAPQSAKGRISPLAERSGEGPRSKGEANPEGPRPENNEMRADLKVKCAKYKVTNLSAGQVITRWYVSNSDSPDGEDVPFSGLVKHIMIQTDAASKKSNEEYHTHIILTGYGNSGAKSVITTEPQKLD